MDEIRKLNEAVGNSLAKELSRGPAQQIKEEIPAISLLINKRHTLRYVGGGENRKGQRVTAFVDSEYDIGDNFFEIGKENSIFGEKKGRVRLSLEIVKGNSFYSRWKR